MSSTSPTPRTPAPSLERPVVSVGMPAYNAAQTIRGSIDCLLSQTLRNLELIISDNASTDGTWDIIDEYARKDPRIIAIRQRDNIGANGNYSAVFSKARGRYFKWASSNDWCAPQFLERCAAHLDEHPETVLVSPRTRLFEGALDRFTDYERDVSFEQADPVDRFVAVGTLLALNNVLNGVARTEVLARTRLIEHYVGADTVLIGHLALLGKISLLDERYFYRRMDQQTATQLMSAEALARHHYPTRTRRSLFSAWRRVGGSLHAAVSSGLSTTDALRALRWVLRTTYWSAGELRRDVADAIAYSVRR
ncbi:glycosyltransferase family 2 protein [Piscinibacter sp.]|uniref:glycosyltransferase family 2 protein n=1 Tax=Piscinibacter sp. TaxID=1903157 RepID=UPI002BB57BD4|nr:glycosyltransferase family 2 protein [Albitalea sp.]HUG26227.1 glycosyltransferase family 2 protein [Albitalea sp.]